MKQIYFFSTILGCMLWSCFAFSQTSPAFDQLKQRLDSLQSFSAEFSQTVTDSQGELLQEAQGQLYLKKPNLLLWNIEEPNESTLIADGSTLWHIDPFVEQVIALNQQEAVVNNPIVLLTSSDNSAWQQFDIRGENGVYSVTAKDNQSQFAALTLKFSENTLVGLIMIDRQDQVSELQFTEIQQNSELSDSLFIFSLPPGFELDDQR